jgi:hypothetical protein
MDPRTHHRRGPALMVGMIQVIDKPCSRYLALLGHQAVRLAVAPCICTYRYLTGLGPPPACCRLGFPCQSALLVLNSLD